MATASLADLVGLGQGGGQSGFGKKGQASGLGADAAVHTDRYSCTRAAQGPCTIIGTFTEVCVYPPLLTVNSLSTYS